MGTVGERQFYRDIGRIARALERLADGDLPPPAHEDVPTLVDLAAYGVRSDAPGVIELRSAADHNGIVRTWPHPVSLADVARAAADHAEARR